MHGNVLPQTNLTIGDTDERIELMSSERKQWATSPLFRVRIHPHCKETQNRFDVAMFASDRQEAVSGCVFFPQLRELVAELLHQEIESSRIDSIVHHFSYGGTTKSLSSPVYYSSKDLVVEQLVDGVSVEDWNKKPVKRSRSAISIALASGSYDKLGLTYKDTDEASTADKRRRPIMGTEFGMRKNDVVWLTDAQGSAYLAKVRHILNRSRLGNVKIEAIAFNPFVSSDDFLYDAHVSPWKVRLLRQDWFQWFASFEGSSEELTNALELYECPNAIAPREGCSNGVRVQPVNHRQTKRRRTVIHVE